MSTEHTGGHEVGMTPLAADTSTTGATAPTDQYAPPAASDAGPAGSGSAPGIASTGGGRGSGPSAIGITLGIFGAIALVGAGGTAALGASAQLMPHGDTAMTVDATGIRGLDLDIGASDVTVQFRDVDEAELAVEGGSGRSWTLDRDGDELIVHSPNRTFGWWFGGWFNNDERITLTLPSSAAGLDVDVDLGAGAVEMDGEFGELDLRLGAGYISVGGSAATVDADISAGRADLHLDGVSEADLTVAAGELVGEFTGSAPDEIIIDVSAGSLRLTLPDSTYRVSQNVSAGSLDNRLDTASSARSTIEVSVSAGSAILRPGD